MGLVIFQGAEGYIVLVVSQKAIWYVLWSLLLRELIGYVCYAVIGRTVLMIEIVCYPVSFVPRGGRHLGSA